MWPIASEPMPPDRIQPGQPRRAQGFTLVELLVVAAVGVVLLAGAVVMVVSHIRSSSRMGALLQLQDHCGRVQVLLNHEIQQAARAADGGSELHLHVPGITTPITYSLENGELRRAGPRIDAQGRLEPQVPSNDLVARGVEAFVVDVSNPRAPRYRLTLRDASGMTYTTGDGNRPDGGAHCRPREITGPGES